MRAVLILLISLSTIHLNEGRLVNGRDFDKVKLDKAGYEKVQTIHYNWYLHSVKAIMGQLGKDVLPKLDRKDILVSDSRRKFLRCLNGIVDKRDVVSAARCLIEAKENLDDITRPFSESTENMSSSKQQHLQDVPSFVRKPTRIQKSRPLRKRKLGPKLHSTKWIRHLPDGGTLQLHIKKQKEKKLWRKYMMLTKTAATKNWRHRSERRVKRSLRRLVADEVSKSDSDGFQVVNMDKAPSLLSRAEKSVVSRVTRLVKTVLHPNEAANKTSKWSESYKALLQIKKALDDKAKQPGARVYDFRMYDLVLGNEKPTRTKGEKNVIPPVVQDAYNLIRTLEGKSKEVGDSSNIKFLSPRFAAIMPDKADIRGSLSPSILSFYKDDAEDQLLPIPKLLDATGMSGKDRDEMLEMVMEITGARQIIDDAMKTLSNTELFGMQGELKEVTERMTKIFTSLKKSFSRPQRKEMKRRGFTFLNTKQLKQLHKQEGLAKHAGEMEFDMDEYGNQTRSQREQALWLRVAEIAANGTKNRSKRQITWLSVMKPTVLSPYMFTPVFGLTVLGPVVLSPSLFSPLLLNPAVLSPYVLSPAVGMPFILSPYLLSPYVLSPLVMAPFILNPYVLSPNVINPYVLSPLILSPLVLCPDLVSPMVLGGSILSPGVLSPSVLSKSFLMASVLSPTVLS
ncbi:hypothetical protein Q1695_012316 [Nippostrongylus brasiliensis]|nr:hypothetical protein Q1695_012316 [Nippostrongylus brasiliensis]